MPQRINWTPAQDTRIKRLRAEGASWDAIAADLQVSRFSIIEHGRRIGAVRPQAAPRPEPVDQDRPALCAGSAISWDAICANTPTLAGTPYPLPVFA